MEMSRDNDQKIAYISDELQLQNPFQLSFTKVDHLSRLPAFHLDNTWLTTLLVPWISWLVPTMWTSANAKTELDNLQGPEMIPFTWT